MGLHHLTFRALAAPLLVSGLLGTPLAHAARTPGGESPTNAGAAPHAQATEGAYARERKSDDAISRRERDFMMRAAEAGLLQVRAARLVVVRSRSPVVKKIATGYVMDHTASLAELTRMANRWSIELPITAPRAKRRQLEHLGKQQGGDFDLTFLQVMGLREHKAAIELFEDARPKIQNPQLRMWLDRTLRTMRRHLNEARDAASGRIAD